LGTDLRWTQDRLRNWGRWSKSQRILGHCRSIEHRYRPERLHEGEEEQRRRGWTPVDVLDALTVWRAIMPQHGMPMSLAMALHGRYAFRLEGDPLRAWLHRHGMSVRGRDLDALVHQAEIAADNRLARLDSRGNAVIMRTSNADTACHTRDVRVIASAE